MKKIFAYLILLFWFTPWVITVGAFLIYGFDPEYFGLPILLQNGFVPVIKSSHNSLLHFILPVGLSIATLSYYRWSLKNEYRFSGLDFWVS